MRFQRCTLAVILVGFGISLTLSPAGETWEGTLGKSAALVLGQEDFVSADANRGGAPSDKTMSAPNDVAIDPTTGRVFVCEGANNRVLRFASPAALADGAAAESVLGQPGAGTGAPATTRSGMSLPTGITVDPAGRLWVADSGNSRVLRFDNASSKPDGANADGVLGQSSFTTGGGGLSQSRMNFPSGIAVDAAGNLWVSERFNHRVLRFAGAATLPDGANADAVLGQVDFESNQRTTNVGTLADPFGVAIDSSGNLWVADSGGHRVLLYRNAASLSGRVEADLMLGQINPRYDVEGLSATKFNSPAGVVVDGAGRVWVSDFNNNRILRFDAGAETVPGAGADSVLGQKDFATPAAGTNRNRLSSPSGMTIDGTGNLWAADTANNRVLRFEPDRFQPDGQVGARAAVLVGNGRYSGEGAAQVVRVRMKGRKKGRAFFRIENDGNLRDHYFGRASRGNRKLKVIYLAGGRNLTGQLVRGVPLGDFTPGEIADLQARIKGTRKSRGRRAGRTLMLDIRSETDGERDVVIAKVKKKPRR